MSSTWRLLPYFSIGWHERQNSVVFERSMCSSRPSTPASIGTTAMTRKANSTALGHASCAACRSSGTEERDRACDALAIKMEVDVTAFRLMSTSRAATDVAIRESVFAQNSAFGRRFWAKELPPSGMTDET